LGNTPAAVVVDPKQPEILFINCLGYPNFFDTALPIARVSNDQILDVWDYPSDVRGIDGRRLEIKTRMGNAKIMMMRDSKQVWPENYEMLRDHLAQEFPGDTSARENLRINDMSLRILLPTAKQLSRNTSSRPGSSLPFSYQ
jgi:hypothetical protein